MNSKNILLPFLAAALCLLAQPVLAATFGKFTYEDSGTSIYIIGYPQDEVGAVAIPATIKGKPVTSILDDAFYRCTGLTSVSIPNSVTDIGSGAFKGCTGLTSVSIPNSVTYIGENAFKSCTGLTSVTIPNSVTYISHGAFSFCTGLTSISIPNSVNEIRYGTFSGCTGLTSVSIPNSVKFIWDDAFRDCTGLTSISIPNSVTIINSEAFSGCTAMSVITVDALNSSYSSFEGVLFNKSMTILEQYPRGRTGSFAIPKGVTKIRYIAFSGCTGLTSVSIPNSVTYIGNRAFSGCTGLTSVSIPNSVTYIDFEAFSRCTGLTSVSIPNSVTEIWSGAFSRCTGLTSVSIPKSVNEIDIEAFAGCAGLTSANFLGTAPKLGYRAFRGTATGFKVYYLEGTRGFTSPTWLGYRSVAIFSGPEIAVQQPAASNLVDGTSKKSFGTIAVGKSGPAKIFTIKNPGTVSLKNLVITKDGTHATNFIVSALAQTSLAPGASTTFEVSFKPSASGTRSAAIHIRSNDSNENPFDINLTGLGAAR